MNDHWQFHSYYKTQSKLLDLNPRAFWDLVPAHVSRLLCYSPLHSCWTLFSSSINSIFFSPPSITCTFPSGNLSISVLLLPPLSGLLLLTPRSQLHHHFFQEAYLLPGPGGSHFYAVPLILFLSWCLVVTACLLSVFPVGARLFQYRDLVSGRCSPRT